MNEVQAMMALARQRAQGVAVGGCGPQMYYNPNGDGAAPGNGNGSTAPQNGPFPGQSWPGDQGPGCNPFPPPVPNMVQPCAVQQTCLVPMGFAFGVDAAGNIYPEALIGAPVAGATGAQPSFNLFTRNSTFEICGVTFFNAPGDVVLDLVQSGDSDKNYMLSETDVASWNTVECFCPANWGCISSVAPLRIQAHAIYPGTSVVTTSIRGVRGTLVGTRRSNLYGCGPLLNQGCG